MVGFAGDREGERGGGGGRMGDFRWIKDAGEYVCKYEEWGIFILGVLLHETAEADHATGKTQLSNVNRTSNGDGKNMEPGVAVFPVRKS